jgi:hypothetical protein
MKSIRFALKALKTLFPRLIGGFPPIDIIQLISLGVTYLGGKYAEKAVDDFADTTYPLIKQKVIESSLAGDVVRYDWVRSSINENALTRKAR